jgi:putative ABC transport system permease protein
MYQRIAIKNMLSRKARTILTILSVSVGVASLVLLFSLSEGLKKAVFSNITSGGPLTQITVQADSQGGMLKLISAKPAKKITAANLEEIKKLPHVASVYPEMAYGNFSSLKVRALGKEFQTDLMIMGVPYEFIAADLKKINGSLTSKDWEQAAAPYPAVFSGKIIDLYNVTIAPTANMPAFTEKDLSGITVTLLPDQSTFFAGQTTQINSVQAKVAGFSDKTSMIAVTLPIQVVRNLNLAKNPAYTDEYVQLFVEADNPENVEPIKTEIQKMGFSTQTVQQQLKSLEDNFRIITIGLSSISLIILFVAALMIINTFLSAVSERKHEIGLFRALGATRGNIRKIFLTEAAIIGGLGALIGILSGLIISLILNKFLLGLLPDLTSKPTNIFSYDPTVLVFIFIFGILISVSAAFIPATKAGRLNPLEALTQ